MKHSCLKCGNEWDSTLKHPKACPKCKSYTWDKPRKREGDGVSTTLP